jgi:MFS family permease
VLPAHAYAPPAAGCVVDFGPGGGGGGGAAAAGEGGCPDESPAKSRRRPTPLPLKEMAVIAATLLNEALLASMLIPFVGNLVATVDKIPISEAGFASGALVSSFYLGQALSGSLWGAMSDTFGRRPTLMCGLLCGSFMTFLFGASGSIPTLLITRFLQGIFNGNLAVAKVIIAEITDETNRAAGYVTINLTYGVGTFVGMFAGGMLYGAFGDGAGFVSGVKGPAGSGLETLTTEAPPTAEVGWVKRFFMEHPAFMPCRFTVSSGSPWSATTCERRRRLSSP